MAITIIKEPSGIYPAYNDSYLIFSSDLADNNKAEISAAPLATFPKPFVLFPDLSGNYIFNIKEIAKTVLNADDFDDANFFDDAFYKSISGFYLLQALTIEVFSDTTSETLGKEYEFFKSVKQVGEDIFTNPLQLLSNSTNGIDYYLTYFEGFPFSFDIQRASVPSAIIIKNVNTGLETDPLTPTAAESFRLNVDNSDGENWTNDNFLELTAGLNKLEIYEDGVFKTNLYLKKKNICSGVLLKWFNSDGGFNVHLFDEFVTEELSGKISDFVRANEFLNVGELNAPFKSTGKDVSRRLKVKTRADVNEMKTLKSLFSSPLVQIYTSRTENVKGTFINVDIEGVFRDKNKPSNNEIVLNIELPELITPKL